MDVKKSSPRFYEIDLLRFVAALMVAIFHYTYCFDTVTHVLASPNPMGRFGKYGYLGVELFFIISGYVVTMSAFNKSIKQFAVSRIVRLYPAFWLSCTLAFISMLIMGNVGVFSSLKLYLYNMTMLHSFFGKISIDGAYWTLALELSFYFLIGLVIGFKLWRYILLLVTVWLGYTLLAGPDSTNNTFAFLFFPKYSPFFISGILFYLLQKNAYKSWKILVLLATSFLLCIRSSNQHMNINNTFFKELKPDFEPFSIYVIAIIITCFFLVFFLISFRKINLSQYPVLARLGELTYPFYLIHSLVGAGLFLAFGKYVNKYLLLVAVIVLMMLLARVINVYVERKLAKPLAAKLNNFFSWLSVKVGAALPE